MLDKTYQPATIEQRHYEQWEKAGAFKAGAGSKEGATPYSIVVAPPNVTGSLHIGHALNNTIQDILIRFERMRGKDVLWQPGMDHAGIATQMVVERKLAEQGLPTRKELGREEFIKKVWEWKEESGGTILNQLRRLGASCDWSRERFTMDEGLSKAVIKVFVELHNKGLIYKDKRLVNWDPVFQTAISDLEVEQKDVNGHMWSFAYPLVDGEVDGINEIVISTTRPETMLGDGAVAVHPSDERYKNLIGKMVYLPIANRQIPIIADEYPDPEFGTGAVKITGAHDFNDFEVARRNNIPLIPLMDGEAKMIVTPENNVPAHYAGLDRFDARKLVLEEIKQLGFYRGEEEKVIAQPFGDRSGVVIEPMLTDQWYVDAEKLAKPAAESVREGRTNFVPDNWKNTYFHWMDNIQPWCISRQLWWGHQIPAWYGQDGKIFVASTEDEAQQAANKHYGKPSKLNRDPDVLDTWFSSGLWAFSTLGWPEKTDELRKYYPTSVLVTGFDIIFFWVARMMMTSLEFMDKEPFSTVYVHALVRDELGAKMSKSKGNVIDPIELIEKFGADAVRFTLSSMAGQGSDIRLSNKAVENNRNFVTKLWNACRFAEMHDCKPIPNFNPKTTTLTLSKWVLSELAETTIAVEKSIEEFKFNEASSAIYKFTWNIFCDWYIELSKPIFFGDNESQKTELKAVTAHVIDHLLHLMHPFMPFVTEELWSRFPRNTQLIISPWPSNTLADNKPAKQEINWLINFITEIRSVRAEMNIPAGAKTPVVMVNTNKDIQAKLTTHNALLIKMARLDTVTTAETVPEGAIQILLDDAIIALPLAGVIDIQAELDRLKKEIDKANKDIQGTQKRLSNKNFTAKAPAKIIEEQNRRLKAAKLLCQNLQQAYKRFEKLAT